MDEQPLLLRPACRKAGNTIFWALLGSAIAIFLIAILYNWSQGEFVCSGFRELKAGKRHDLWIAYGQRTDDILKKVATTPGLTELTIEKCDVSADGLSALSQSRGLTSLRLWGLWNLNIDGAGLMCLQGLTTLRDLDVDTRLANSPGFAVITRLPNLLKVTINCEARGEVVERSAIDILAAAPQIHEITFYGVPSGADLSYLRAALPMCVVTAKTK